MRRAILRELNRALWSLLFLQLHGNFSLLNSLKSFTLTVSFTSVLSFILSFS